MTRSIAAIIALGLALGCTDDPDASVVDAGPADGASDVMVDTLVDVMPDAMPDATDDVIVADSGGGDALVDAIPDATAGPPACDPSLMLEPAEAWTPPGGLVVFGPTGGTGAYAFSVLDPQSPGQIGGDIGAYLAGPTPGVVDTVRLTDAGCAGEARATITVTAPLGLSPRRVELGPGDTVTFEVLGGSGRVEWRLSLDRSGARVDPAGAYTAGPGLGTDVIEVVDLRTGERVDALIDVVAEPIFSLEPARVSLVLGASTGLQATGGSGHLALEVEGEAIEVDPETLALTAVAAGRGTVRVTDRFTGQVGRARVQVAPPLGAELVRGHTGWTAGRWARADLNGDGRLDVVMGAGSASIDGAGDGGVLVWHGGPDGLGPEPVQIMGAAAGDQFGADVALIDVDGDGRLDLVAGGLRAEGGAFDSGHVRIHAGLDGGLFDPEAMQILVALDVRAELGAQLAHCDLDDDGFTDLVAGLRRGELWVFRGGPAGFEETPAYAIPSVVPDADGWVEAAGLGLGADRGDVSTGDVDGDGRCDVVASLMGWALDADARDDGAVYVWSGPDIVDDGPTVPRRAWFSDRPDQRNVGFGDRLLVSDLDGDGRDEIVVGTPGLDGEGVANRGAVFVLPGAPFDARVVRSIDEVATRMGPAYNSQMGLGLATVDLGADGGTTLLVSTAAVSTDDGLVGRIDGWSGAAALDLGEPDRTLFGGPPESQVGNLMVALDAGDDTPTLAWFSATDPVHGHRVGSPWTAALDEALEPRRLGYPGAIGAGSRVGGALAAVDVDGDDVAELIVGAPMMADPGPGRGAVWLHRLDDGPAPQTSWPADVNGFGHGLATGDFDGDGQPDLAIWSNRARRPAEAPDPMTHRVDGQCVFDGAETGVIAVYRGQPDGFAEAPAFVWYGQRHLGWPVMADLDGDGLDDLLSGSNQAGDARDMGGVEMVRGRVADPGGRVRVLCDPAWSFYGGARGVDWAAFLGIANAALGDLDGDGCDEVAFGSYGETPEGLINIRHGVVRVLFGWGGPGCPAVPEVVAISPGVARQSFGGTLAAGDLNGDGLAEIAVSAREGNQVRVIDGAWVAGLPRGPWVMPTATAPPEQPGTVPLRAFGSTSAEQYGQGMAIVDGRLVVGFTARSLGDDVPEVGGADIYRIVDGGLVLDARIIGETWRRGGRVGEVIVGLPGRGAVAIAGSSASGLQPTAGAVYVFELDAID